MTFDEWEEFIAEASESMTPLEFRRAAYRAGLLHAAEIADDKGRQWSFLRSLKMTHFGEAAKLLVDAIRAAAAKEGE